MAPMSEVQTRATAFAGCDCRWVSLRGDAASSRHDPARVHDDIEVTATDEAASANAAKASVT